MHFNRPLIGCLAVSLIAGCAASSTSDSPTAEDDLTSAHFSEKLKPFLEDYSTISSCTWRNASTPPNNLQNPCELTEGSARLLGRKRSPTVSTPIIDVVVRGEKIVGDFNVGAPLEQTSCSTLRDDYVGSDTYGCWSVSNGTLTVVRPKLGVGQFEWFTAERSEDGGRITLHSHLDQDGASQELTLIATK